MANCATRRQLLKMTAAGVAAMAATPAKMLAQSTAPEFPKPETPEAAIKLLLDGNGRYLKKGSECMINLVALRKATEEDQKPFAVILTCADSRVPAEIIFDQSIGQLFVVRVAGNIAAPDTIASVEYAAEELGVKTILVLGHSGCGAVKATKAGGAVPGQISELFQYIYPATVGAPDLQTAVERNARLQALVLRESSPDLVQLIKDRKLSVEAAVYSLSTGKVTMLGRETTSPASTGR